jgi:hypothetical protein
VTALSSSGGIVGRSSWQTLLARPLQRPLNLWSDHPPVDLVIVGLLMAAHLWLVYGQGHGNVLGWAGQGQRLALYGAGATMITIIAGFVGTAIAQYGSSSGPVVTALRSAHGRAIRRNWLNITRWLLTCTVLCLVAMAVDGDGSPRGSEWIFEFALAISVVKFARLLFLYGLIMSAVDSEANAPDRPRNPRHSPSPA